jgi:hypothetical protein
MAAMADVSPTAAKPATGNVAAPPVAAETVYYNDNYLFVEVRIETCLYFI